MKQDVAPIDSKGEYHGYQEWYWKADNTLWIRVVAKNSKYIGYYENHRTKHTKYYIK